MGGATRLRKVRLVIPHFTRLPERDRKRVAGPLTTAAAWDAVYEAGQWRITADPAEWRRDVQALEREPRQADAVSTLLDELDVRRLASYGAGHCYLEAWIKRLRPSVEIIVSDFAPAAVKRLELLFPEAVVVRHDLGEDPPIEADLHLFSILDFEFSNREWTDILQRFRAERILFLYETKRPVDLLKSALNVAGGTRAGWNRTRGSLESLVATEHHASRVPAGDLSGLLLSPR